MRTGTRKDDNPFYFMGIQAGRSFNYEPSILNTFDKQFAE